MTLLKKKREILKKSSLCLGKGGVKYGNSFKTTGKKYNNNSQKIPSSSSQQAHARSSFATTERPPAPPTARQNGLRNFIRRVCDEILAEVVLEEQLQSAIYEQIVHQNQRVQTKSIVRRARDWRAVDGPEVGPEHAVPNLRWVHWWFVEKSAGT